MNPRNLTFVSEILRFFFSAARVRVPSICAICPCSSVAVPWGCFDMLPFWRFGKVVKSLDVVGRHCFYEGYEWEWYIFLHGIFAYMKGMFAYMVKPIGSMVYLPTWMVHVLWDQCRFYAGIPYMDIFSPVFQVDSCLIFHGGFVDFYVHQRLKPIFTTSCRIHGNGISTSMNGWCWCFLESIRR